jgi:hypothetical protein
MMADDPTATPKHPPAKRPGIANADVPSETVGLPGVGEGASAAHFARDTVQWQGAEPDEPDGAASAGSDNRAG